MDPVEEEHENVHFGDSHHGKQDNEWDEGSIERSEHKAQDLGSETESEQRLGYCRQIN